MIVRDGPTVLRRCRQCERSLPIPRLFDAAVPLCWPCHLGKNTSKEARQ